MSPESKTPVRKKTHVRKKSSSPKKVSGKRKSSAAGRRKKKSVRKGPPRNRSEDRATIASYFCSHGLGATAIQKVLKEKHSISMTREAVYNHVRDAAADGWIRFHPPPDIALQLWLREEAYPWLQDASVVQTTRFDDVAQRGAKMLLELLQQRYSGKEVHVGFSGGTALRTLARRFAELLRDPAHGLPSKIVFHALVAGFDVSDPTTDPNAFFTYFVEDPAIEVKTAFVALNSPAMATPDIEEKLRNLPAIGEAYERAREIDIIVTSTSGWKDDHSMLRNYMDVAGEPVGMLGNEGCIGDMLWQPIGPKGPFELQMNMRAMTVMKLSDVSDHVANGGQVLLVAGPCASCHTPKTDVVDAILGQEKRLVTHLAVDSRCVRALRLLRH